ncbi:MAG: glycosyltransferase family 4 protein [Desulfohalobiaceae bacterium]|nr:glycosyltransferase family 4 protein [Desulfohalobiaceae bacterium]
MQQTIAISANTSWYLYNFRKSLIQRLQASIFDVVAVAPNDAYSEKLQGLVSAYYPLKMDANGTSIHRDLLTCYAYYRTYRRIKPALVLQYTPKTNIYGTLAARWAKIPCINNIAGLGTAFLRSGLLPWLVRGLYKGSQPHAFRLFFQNPDDLATFSRYRLVPQDRIVLLPGSGVDVQHFSPRERNGRDSFTFLLLGRLLWDKGVGEYVEAARILKNRDHSLCFQLLGQMNPSNPRSVGKDQLGQWQEEGLIEWLGEVEDVRPSIAEADCVVLPSYREGTPRSLLEAAAMAKPLNHHRFCWLPRSA